MFGVQERVFIGHIVNYHHGVGFTKVLAGDGPIKRNTAYLLVIKFLDALMGFVQICHVCQRKVELIQFQDLFITQTVQCSLHVSVSNATSEFPDDEFLLKTRPLKLFCAILCYFAH